MEQSWDTKLNLVTALVTFQMIHCPQSMQFKVKIIFVEFYKFLQILNGKNVKLLGCQVEIWEDTNERGDYFKCTGNDRKAYDPWCDMNDLGSVGNDEASTITCTCEEDILNIVFDTRPSKWVPTIDKSSGKQLQSKTTINRCNPARDHFLQIRGDSMIVDENFSTRIFLKMQHLVPYTGKIKAIYSFLISEN